MPSRPPSLFEFASLMVAAVVVTSSPLARRCGPTLRMRRLWRSVTSAPPSGRNVTPHGMSRFRTSVVTETRASPRDPGSRGPGLKLVGSGMWDGPVGVVVLATLWSDVLAASPPSAASSRHAKAYAARMTARRRGRSLAVASMDVLLCRDPRVGT
jgi:hypothetical protein